MSEKRKKEGKKKHFKESNSGQWMTITRYRRLYLEINSTVEDKYRMPNSVLKVTFRDFRLFSTFAENRWPKPGLRQKLYQRELPDWTNEPSRKPSSKQWRSSFVTIQEVCFI